MRTLFFHFLRQRIKSIWLLEPFGSWQVQSLFGFFINIVFVAVKWCSSIKSKSLAPFRLVFWINLSIPVVSLVDHIMSDFQLVISQNLGFPWTWFVKAFQRMTKFRYLINILDFYSKFTFKVLSIFLLFIFKRIW